MAKADSDQLFGAVLQRLANTYLKPAKGNCSAPTLLKALSPASTGGSTGRKLDFTPYVPSERNLRVWLQNMGVPGASNQEGFVKLVKFTLNISDEEERSLDAAINLTRRISVKEREAFKIDRIGGLIARGPREKTDDVHSAAKLWTVNTFGTGLDGGKDQGAQLADDSIWVFGSQAAAYKHIENLIESMQSCEVTSATRVQASGSRVFGLLSTLVRHIPEEAVTATDQNRSSSPPIRLFTARPEVLLSLGSFQQPRLIAETRSRIRQENEMTKGGWARRLTVLSYLSPPSLSGLSISIKSKEITLDGQGNLLLLGIGTYEQAHDHDPAIPGKRNDESPSQESLFYSAHDRAAFVVRGDSPLYKILKPTFDDIVSNLEIVAQTAEMSWVSPEMSQGTVAFFRQQSLLPERDRDRLQSLLPEENRGHTFISSEASRLALWASEPFDRITALFEGMRQLYKAVGLHATDVALYNLTVGWAWRELWVERVVGQGQESAHEVLFPGERDDPPHYLDRAERRLMEALTHWRQAVGEPTFLQQAFAHDRLGTVWHLRGFYSGQYGLLAKPRDECYKVARDEYEKALRLVQLERRKELSKQGTLLRGWVHLNRAMLGFDSNEDKERSVLGEFHHALKAFEEVHDRRGLLYVLATAACFAASWGQVKEAAYLLGALRKDIATISPTYQRWVAQAQAVVDIEPSVVKEQAANALNDGAPENLEKALEVARNVLPEGRNSQSVNP